jgi:hypothetical protein
MNRLLKYKEFVNFLAESHRSVILTDNENLNEGGAYGHLAHPFEDIGLTFLDLEEMLLTTVRGAFGPENFVQEKTDGQQLSISWKNGQLIAARNKSHLTNAGECAFTVKGVALTKGAKAAVEAAGGKFVEAS